ncbi:stress response protein [Fusarium heterosporum]|uniref:Stress response protein n=1 Tax=Fusarium heterosporum TaxID=42747 RepID=A0A8H5TVH0_FUSHE|nr:stress response protein [Fusarium heterosporum]
MASIKTVLFGLFASTALAIPSGPRFTKRQLQYHDMSKRQNDAAAAAGLTDVDILQFALTLEHLEDTFYRQAFQTISDEAFAPLGLSANTLADIKAIGQTEASHVVLLQSALAGAGFTPVEECTYDFGAATADPAAMVATAAILESVGVSAYLGAAPLLSDPGILSTAGAILTVEARHQTAIRVFSQAKAVPQPLDTPLGPKAVFSLAAPFIKACPDGSNLKIEAFPALAMAEGQAVEAVAIGAKVKFASEAAAGATHCGFTAGGLLPGGTKFTKFTEADGCEVPQGAAGIVYVSLTSAGPIEGVLSDDITVAGPMVLTLS